MKATENIQKHTYIALLRAINVGGYAVIKMADLKKLFESCGLTDVTTYIQSGNVIFTLKKTRSEKLEAQIEKKLKSSTGKDIKVFLLTPGELIKAVSHNPFNPEHRDKEQRCHLMFLSGKPDEVHSKALMKLEGREYQFHIHEDILYYAYPNEFAGNRRNIDFEKVLGVYGTSRSWKVVDKLIELSEQLKK